MISFKQTYMLKLNWPECARLFLSDRFPQVSETWSIFAMTHKNIVSNTFWSGLDSPQLAIFPTGSTDQGLKGFFVPKKGKMPCAGVQREYDTNIVPAVWDETTINEYMAVLQV